MARFFSYLFKLFAVVLLSASLAFGAPGKSKQRNLITRHQFEIRNSVTGELISGATALDCEYSQYADGSNPGSFADVSGTETEIGSSGVYYVTLTAGETNSDYFMIKCSSSSTNAVTSVTDYDTLHGTVLTNASGQLADNTLPASASSPRNTAQAVTASTIQFASTESFADDDLNNNVAVFIASASTGAGQTRCITDYVGSTDTATITPNWQTTPTGTVKYDLVPQANCNVTGVGDWTNTEKENIRSALGVTGTKTTAASGQLQDIKTKTDGLNFTGTDVKATLDSETVALTSTSENSVVDKVWDEARSGHTSNGTFGHGVVVATNNDKTAYFISGTKTTLDSLNDVSNANVLSQCTSALGTYDGPTMTEMTAAFTEIKGGSWSAVTDTLRAIALGGGGGGGGGGDCANVDEIADAVWDEILLGNHVTTNSAGKNLLDALNSTLTCEVRRE